MFSMRPVKLFQCLLVLYITIVLLSTATAEAAAKCINGKAKGYACKKIDLLSEVNFNKLGGTSHGSNLWGFVDPDDGREYALLGYSRGTAIIEVTNPKKPRIVTIVSGLGSRWREIKVYSRYNKKKKRYDSYAYVVTEANGQGLQIVDLSELPAGANLIRSDLDVDASHTLFISNVDYATGVTLPGLTATLYVMDSYVTGRGVTIFSLKNPSNPKIIGHYNTRVHDMYAETFTDSRVKQCAPGHNPCEILFGWHAHYIQVVDVTDKANPVDISALHPTAAVGSHSGWISKDKQWLFSFDEGDEIQNGFNTLIRSIRISNLQSSTTFASWVGKTPAIEHNGYVVGDELFVSNYTAGFRLFDASNPKKLKLIAYFDTFSPHDEPVFSGAWGVYPFLKSGNILISDINRGLFVLGRQ
jgi:choice-of-anchor B domain-containing protein